MQLRLIRMEKKKKKKGGRQIQKNTVVTIKTDAHTIMCLSKNNETILATFSVVINAYSHWKLSFLCKCGQK